LVLILLPLSEKFLGIDVSSYILNELINHGLLDQRIYCVTTHLITQKLLRTPLN